ncbi:glycosyl transferase family 1 [Flavobacterium magnum]|uniref:Glycosyl transferase family 1 n=1 Tax=Flavobacterium magnum TaxID=2162713 RepID=A0A2S0RGC0_9FLAO|nr:glycosyltransferase [Flavobacterium magnum]AWA30706.1 glycosyl transferase family 1 [Flavobacterium magnum]
MDTGPQKVLIITYYWPPAGGPGVQRWLKFVKYLPDFGITPIVYVPENPTYPIVDEGLLADVTDRAIILKHKITEPYGLATAFSGKKSRKLSSGIIPHQKKQSVLERLMLWVRGNLFIPDARVLWVKPSVKYLSRYIRDNNIDTIITSGPPHSLHLIGLGLKKEFTVNWVADFRDPWTTIGYHKALKLSSYASGKHKKLEREVLTAADTVLVTSNTTKTEFRSLTSRPIEVITNGYDAEIIGKIERDAKFSLAHIGSFLSERNPRILWESLSELVLEHSAFANDFELKLIGAVSREVLDSISEHRLDSYLNNLGYVPHSEAVKQQRSAQVLLLIEINSDDTKSIIPGKLFEYMVSERPIIGIGPEGSDFASILKETNTGKFFTYDQKASLKGSILAYYELYRENNLKVYPVGLQQYSRKQLTAKLASLLKKANG